MFCHLKAPFLGKISGLFVWFLRCKVVGLAILLYLFSSLLRWDKTSSALWKLLSFCIPGRGVNSMWRKTVTPRFRLSWPSDSHYKIWRLWLPNTSQIVKMMDSLLSCLAWRVAEDFHQMHIILYYFCNAGKNFVFPCDTFISSVWFSNFI